MKSSEFHKLVLINGWTEVRQTGSHKIYEKAGKRVAVPYHGSKEMKKGLEIKLKKEMGL
jgi:predicted RNA binding protein YcfA (HicA-like mRNA interferase family)